MTLDGFIGLLRDSVRYADRSTNKKLDSFQTFALVSGLGDANADNLGKSVRDLGKPYFYSLKWEALGHHASNVAFEYPALLAIKMSVGYEELFTQKESELWDIQLNAVYPHYPLTEARHTAADRLLVEEIHPAMARLLHSTLRYIEGAVFASTNLDPVEKWYNIEILKALKLAGTITDYTVNQPKTNTFLRSLRELNAQAGGGIIDNQGKDQLHGVQTTIRVRVRTCEEYEPVLFNHARPDCCAGYQ